MIKTLAILIGLIIVAILVVKTSIKIEFSQEEIDKSIGIEDPFINKK